MSPGLVQSTWTGHKSFDTLLPVLLPWGRAFLYHNPRNACFIICNHKMSGSLCRTILECLLFVLQLYLHHLFGPSDLVTGEGAEFRGYHDAPPLPHPYYTVVNGSHFTSEMSRYDFLCTVCLFLHVLYACSCMCSAPATENFAVAHCHGTLAMMDFSTLCYASPPPSIPHRITVPPGQCPRPVLTLK